MSRFRRYEIIEEEPLPFPLPFCHSSSSHFFVTETLPFASFVEESLPFNLDLCLLPSHFHADLVRVDRTASFLQKRVEKQQKLGLESLSDRVAELESRFEQILGGKKKEEKKKKNIGGGGGCNRKYTWTTEIKGAEKNGFDRKYKWIAEIVEEEKKKKKSAVVKNVKWTAEIKGKGEDSENTRRYTFAVESGGDDAEKKKKKKNVNEKEKVKEEENVKDKKKERKLRIVEIEEPDDHRVVVLRQAYAKRFGAVQNQRGKKKELSPQDAALLIQITFRAYIIRRSKALRALRELAVAKSKLKELRAQFNNFSYRRRLASDPVECQRFSERVIVLLLTVDAIEGVDQMVRSAKKSMVDELEAMLDVVDPQPTGGSQSFKRRTFDMPDGVIRKEIEEGVAQVVQMLDEAENSSSTYEASHRD